MMPGEVSASESGSITIFLQGIFGSEFISEHLIRKTAHFCEYMLLGILCVSDFRLWNKKGITAFFTILYICLAVSVIDESIQLFTVGRSGALFDVWLDHIGSLTGCVCMTILSKIVKK